MDSQTAWHRWSTSCLCLLHCLRPLLHVDRERPAHCRCASTSPSLCRPSAAPDTKRGKYSFSKKKKRGKKSISVSLLNCLWLNVTNTKFCTGVYNRVHQESKKILLKLHLVYVLMSRDWQKFTFSNTLYPPGWYKMIVLHLFFYIPNKISFFLM